MLMDLGHPSAGGLNPDDSGRRWESWRLPNAGPYKELMDAWKATIPANRFAEPEEIAYAATFLASPQAGYISGTSLLVDGGRIKALS